MCNNRLFVLINHEKVTFFFIIKRLNWVSQLKSSKRISLVSEVNNLS